MAPQIEPSMRYGSGPVAAPGRKAGARAWTKAVAAGLAAFAVAGCGFLGSESPGSRGGDSAKKDASAGGNGNGDGKGGPRVVRPERRDLRMLVVQPGTIQAYEATPIFPRIAGYVEKYNANIGDRVEAGAVLVEMWIPDLVEQLKQKASATKRAEVQIRVAESMLKAAGSSLEMFKARVTLSEAGVARSQAAYTRWESEYKRLSQLVAGRVLNEQVRDETYRQFEEAVAARDQAHAAVTGAVADREKSAADLERARVDVEAARADLDVARAEQQQAQVMVDYGKIKAPYAGVITQRNISPGDYLQPGGGTNGRPLYILEQIDPVRVFVGVPELASAFIKDHDKALIRIQAVPGDTREGTIVRSGFSLSPSTRTLQAEIDIPNPRGFLRPGMYVTVTIAIERKDAFTLPSNAIGYGGAQNYFVFLQVDGKPVKTPVLIGPSDDSRTEVLRKRNPDGPADAWVEFDGGERVLVGSLDALNGGQPSPSPGR